MNPSLWAGILASKTAKIGAGVMAGGSSLVIIINMVSARINDLNDKIDYTVKQTHEYVDIKHERVMAEIENVARGQSEIKDILKTIERRMYDERNQKQED